MRASTPLVKQRVHGVGRLWSPYLAIIRNKPVIFRTPQFQHAEPVRDGYRVTVWGAC